MELDARGRGLRAALAAVLVGADAPELCVGHPAEAEAGVMTPTRLHPVRPRTEQGD